MKKAKSKFISLLLIVVMLLNFLPASANATVSDADAQTSTGVTTVPNPDYVELGSVRELESRREENVKHFLLPDNTVQAVVYADAVHRMDDSGNWQDISNDLSLTEYKGVKFYTTADGRVVFAEKYAPNTQLWQLSENGYSIAMGMTQLQLSADATVTPIGGVTVTNAPVRRSATTWHSVEEARVVDNTASIVYANVKTNTDLEYIMIGNDIKENIVVKSRSNSYTYQFDLVLTGLAATQKGDGSISLTDSATGQQQYTIPAPYMVDATGERSNAVTYALKQTGEGQYALTVTADSTWINADDRVFPVKIDPTVTYDEIIDTYINPDHPNENYLGAEDLIIMDGSAAFFITWIPSLPENMELLYAALHVSYELPNDETDDENQEETNKFVYAGAYQMEEVWSPANYTWNIANQYANFGSSSTMLSIGILTDEQGSYENTTRTTEFNITSAAQNWYNGEPNYGLSIKYFAGTLPSVTIKSSESEAQCRPYFTFQYSEDRLANGVYSLQNIGSLKYMDVKDGGRYAGTVVQQNQQVVIQEPYKQLFKVTFLETIGNEHYYSIRPMTNSALGLSAPLSGSTRNVTVETMSYTDDFASINNEQRWSIILSGNSYKLRNGAPVNGGYLTWNYMQMGQQLCTMVDMGDYSSWRFEPYYELIEEVQFTNQLIAVPIGAPYHVNAVFYSSEIGVNGPIVYGILDTDSPDEPKATITSDTGVFVGTRAGPIAITAQINHVNVLFHFSLKIVEVPNSITVNIDVYYEQGYSLWEGYYDTRIIDQLDALRTRYWSEFGITINYNTPTTFDCPACECENRDAIGNCQCTDETECEVINESGEIIYNHHTNYHNIMHSMPYRGVEEAFCVGYYRHNTLCTANYHSGGNAGYGGLTASHLGLVAVTDTTSDIVERQTLFHEFGHIYGAPDHYGDIMKNGENDPSQVVAESTAEIIARTGDTRFNEYCIYGEKNGDPSVMSNHTICDGCRAIILSNRYAYSHAD